MKYEGICLYFAKKCGIVIDMYFRGGKRDKKGFFMKKKVLISLLCAAVAVSLLACGNGNENNAQSTDAVVENTADNSQDNSGNAAEATETVNSLSIDYDVTSCVSKLADYTNLEVSLSGTYEIPQAYVDEALDNLLSSVGLDMREVIGRDTVQEGDIANIDYAGYLNDVAFDGGTAKGTDLGIGSGTFVPGFEEGLIGAKVGETVTIDVTFPENYGNADLAGQLTQFVVTINSIKAPVTVDMLTDEEVADNFGELYQITTVDGLKEYALGYVEEQAVNGSIIEQVIANSTVTIPEDYLNARAYEMVEQQVAYYYGVDLATFGTMLESSGSSIDEYVGSAKDVVAETITQEMVFEAIGVAEGFDSYGADYDAFIQKNLDASALTSAEELYESVGAGNKTYGEKYAKRMYLMNAALDFVKKNASVSGAQVYTYKEQ